MNRNAGPAHFIHMTTQRSSNRAEAQALEAYLVAAARTGDRQAMDQLARLVGPRLMAHAARLTGDAEVARDVVQSAWVDILRGLPGLRAIAAFRSFALQIVTRKVARQIKGLQQQRTLERDFAAEAEKSAPPLGDAAADAATVRRAIDCLPPVHRATLALFYLDEFSVAEVATSMDVPVGTVKTRLLHARAKMREILKGETDDQD